jgi:SAM-dependent methyltransferase
MAKTTVRVDPGNEAQLAAWNGDEGVYWVRNADRFDASLAAHHGPFMAAAGIAADDDVLDVGCGTGRATLDAARVAPEGGALGVDLSAAMLDVAAHRAVVEGIPNVAFLQADAQVHGFDPSHFTVVISRTAAMFFADQAVAFANLRRALRAGGRLILLTWQPLERNEWLLAIAEALSPGSPPRVPPPGVGPFSLSEPSRVRELLADAGFTGIELHSSEAPMVFGSDGDDATRFILGLQGWMLDGFDEPARHRAIDALHAVCMAHETPDGAAFASAGWITTASAG